MFDCETVPTLTYRVGGVILTKQKTFISNENRILIKYTLVDAHSDTTLQFRPMLAFRNANDLVMENSAINTEVREVADGVSTCLYAGYPDLVMQFSKPVKWVNDGHWYKGIEYYKDRDRGIPYKEDLWVPGYFELPIKKGESIIFSAGTSEIAPADLEQLYDSEIDSRTPRTSFYNCLKNSAKQFYLSNANGKYIICHAWVYRESENGTTAVDGDAVAYYEVETGKFEILPGSNGMYANVVDNNGTVYAATPAGSPLREWAVYRNGYWYTASQILSQAYDMNFYAYTNYGNTGTISDISADGRIMTVMVDPRGESYTLTTYDDFSKLCDGINLLQNYTVSPTSGSAFSKLRSVEIAFDRNVQVVGQANAAALTKADGTPVRNSAGLAVSTQSKKTIVVTFRPQTLTEGEKYVVTIPAGTISLENDPA